MLQIVQSILKTAVIIFMLTGPSLMFLGLLRGLRSMQSNSLVRLIESNNNEMVREVTLGDAVRGAFYGQEDYTEREKYIGKK